MKIQKSGDSSVNVQGETVAISTGVTYSEVKEIALDVFNSNFYKLSEIAATTATARAEEFTEKFLESLKKKNPQGIAQANDPEFQHSLFTAQTEYARSGDEDLGSLLVQLLTDQSKSETRSLLRLVRRESLAVAPKLTGPQIDALSIAFLFTHTESNRVVTTEAFWEYLATHVEPIVANASFSESCNQHLIFAGCAAKNIIAKPLGELFKKRYGGLFSKGFEQTADLSELSGEVRELSIIQCLNDSTRLQVAVLNVDVINHRHLKSVYTETEKRKLTNLFNSDLMDSEEIEEFVTKKCPFMKRVFKNWQKGPGMLELSSVGIAIAHANLQRHIPDFTDLSIWIHEFSKEQETEIST